MIPPDPQSGRGGRPPHPTSSPAFGASAPVLGPWFPSTFQPWLRPCTRCECRLISRPRCETSSRADAILFRLTWLSLKIWSRDAGKHCGSSSAAEARGSRSASPPHCLRHARLEHISRLPCSLHPTASDYTQVDTVDFTKRTNERKKFIRQ